MSEEQTQHSAEDFMRFATYDLKSLYHVLQGYTHIFELLLKEPDETLEKQMISWTNDMQRVVQNILDYISHFRIEETRTDANYKMVAWHWQEARSLITLVDRFCEKLPDTYDDALAQRVANKSRRLSEHLSEMKNRIDESSDKG